MRGELLAAESLNFKSMRTNLLLKEDDGVRPDVSDVRTKGNA